MNKKVQEIEEVLGIKLRAGIYDLEFFEEDWKEFFNHPKKYAGSVVVDMIKEWYKEMYQDRGFTDRYYLDGF